jgi:hypothetical protein
MPSPALSASNWEYEGKLSCIMFELGKGILVFGFVAVLIGAGIMLAARLGLPLGRLPGDVAYRGKHVSIFFPIGTSILISIVLSLIFYLLSRFHR